MTSTKSNKIENSSATPLTRWRIPHLDVVLDEIFYIPPARLFPDASRPQTLGDLAAASRLPQHEVESRLELCEQMSENIEISCETLQAQLEAGGELPWLLDVRQDWEYKICHLPGSLLLGGADFPALLTRLKADPARGIVTICHHGVRSYSAALYLREQGLPQVQSLRGGLDEWAASIDTTMARY